MHFLRKLSVLPLAWFSTGLIFVSEREREFYLNSFIGRLRGARQVIDVVPIGVNVEIPELDKNAVLQTRNEIFRDHVAPRQILLGFFGFIYAWKQPEKMLGVVQQLVKRGIDARLLLCGDFPDGHDEERQRFRRLVSELGLEERVIHKGYIEDERTLAQMLGACDAHLCLYKDGVSSRRGSFWYSLKLGARMICTAPEDPREFGHLLDFDRLISERKISLVAPSIDVEALAEIANELPPYEMPVAPSAEPPDWHKIANRHKAIYAACLGD